MALSRTKKVLVGMSGGVDSSVAAALLLEQGWEVIGLSLTLFSCNLVQPGNCCSAADRMDARAVCEKLGIPHVVADRSSSFRESVIDPFVTDYVRGRTPSPCILCNQRVKFSALCEEAERLGAECIATGHYARVISEVAGPRLLTAIDRRKDQSYFLFELSKGVLGRLVLPLGEMTKDGVRAKARGLGLPTSEKDESQEICFVPDDDYVRFVEEHAATRLSGPGRFVDMEGRAIGRHEGIHAYTIGQRRGLKIGGGNRQYVVSIDREKNEVVLGSDADLAAEGLIASDVSWIRPVESIPGDVTVRIRSSHAGARAALELMDDSRVKVRFATPVRAVAPGQAAVFYDGDEVLGGGWIER